MRHLGQAPIPRHGWRADARGQSPKHQKETELAATLLPALEKTLERRLKAEQTGDVRFDAFTRGRYATDASHYQIMPLGVVTPRSAADAEGALAVCRSAYERWAERADADLTVYLDQALQALSVGFDPARLAR